MSRNLKSYTRRASLLAASYAALGYTRSFYATNAKSSRPVYDTRKAERLSAPAAIDLAIDEIRKNSHLSHFDALDIQDGVYDALSQVIDGSIWDFFANRTKAQAIRKLRKAAEVAAAA